MAGTVGGTDDVMPFEHKLDKSRNISWTIQGISRRSFPQNASGSTTPEYGGMLHFDLLMRKTRKLTKRIMARCVCWPRDGGV